MHLRCGSGWNKQFQKLINSSSGFREEENFLALRWGRRGKREQLQNKFGNSQYLLNSSRLPVTTLSAFSVSVSLLISATQRKRYYLAFHYVYKTNRLGVVGQPPIFRCLGTRMLLITVSHSCHYVFLHWYQVTLTWDWRVKGTQGTWNFLANKKKMNFRHLQTLIPSFLKRIIITNISDSTGFSASLIPA